MPTHRLARDCALHCCVDDDTDPWREPETVLTLHGNAESDPDRCAQATREIIARVSSSRGQGLAGA